MCDHVFDLQILRCLLEAWNGDRRSLLAVDRRIDEVFDLEDATKVQVDGKRLTTIGKKIAPFNAVDTGLFLCQPCVFEALRKAGREGDDTLTGGIRQLIIAEEIEALDIGKRFWIDVDTGEDLSHAKGLLLAGLSKPEEDGFIARSMNRSLSRWISERLVRTRLTPNTITLWSFLMCLSGAVLFGLGEYVWTLLAGLLIQAASVMDGCDGEVARLKFLSSRFGAWLDTVLDRYADVAIAAGICSGQWLTTPGPAVWVGGLMATSGFLLASYMKKEYTLRYGHKLLGGVVERLLKRDMRLFVLFAAALLNRPFEALVLAGLLTHLGIGWTLLGVYRRERRP
jgi:CDP-L-myo-inositol myo-inositolphosphotransferase